MNNNDHWFSLKPHVYVEFGQRGDIFIYNTENGKYTETNVAEAVSLISDMYKPENLGVTVLSSEMSKKLEIIDFLKSLNENDMCDIVEIENISYRPVVLIPVLNLEKDIDNPKNKEPGDDLLSYMLELNLFINDSCSRDCKYCSSYRKQVRCCTASNSGAELSVGTIESVLNQIKYSGINRINVTGGNITEYGNKEKLFELLKDLSPITCYEIHYKNFEPGKFPENCRMNLTTTFPVDRSALDRALSGMRKSEAPVSFIIENEETYYETEKLIEEFEIERFEILPFYNGRNLDFFENNIYTNKEDIFSTRLKMREIFRNQKLNSNYFGNLNVLPDGTVKADFNADSIGNVKTDSMLEILYREMTRNTAWRRVRDSKPCSECLYRRICQSPGNYETAIGKPNLCNIVKNRL